MVETYKPGPMPLDKAFDRPDEVFQEVMPLSADEEVGEAMLKVVVALQEMATVWSEKAAVGKPEEEEALRQLVVTASSIGLISGFVVKETSRNSQTAAWAGAIVLATIARIIGLTVNDPQILGLVPEDAIGETIGNA